MNLISDAHEWIMGMVVDVKDRDGLQLSLQEFL